MGILLSTSGCSRRFGIRGWRFPCGLEWRSVAGPVQRQVKRSVKDGCSLVDRQSETGLGLNRHLDSDQRALVRRPQC